MSNKFPFSFIPGILGEDAQPTIDFMLSPDVEKVIDHFQQGLKERQPTKEDELELEWLADNLEAARQALKDGDIGRACRSFFDIGYLVGGFFMPTADGMEPMIDLASEALKRRQPLYERHMKDKYLRQIAQKLAINAWAADVEDLILIGKMAESVKSDLKAMGGEIEKSLPRQTNTIKGWIRPVAPDYAKLPGRPRKK